MNGKTKLFVIFAIICVLHTCTAAERKCKHGVSYKAGRKGTLKEVKESIGKETCRLQTDVCLSIRADEVQSTMGIG